MSLEQQHPSSHFLQEKVPSPHNTISLLTLSLLTCETMLSTRLPSIISNTRQFLKLHSHHAKKQKGVPKGHVAVYVGENEMKRYVVPITYLSHPTFQGLLRLAEEEFGYSHPMGGLTLPCKEEAFVDITRHLSCQ